MNLQPNSDLAAVPTLVAVDLASFCSAQSDIGFLAAPWTHEGYAYATDGALLIRIPQSEEIAPLPGTPVIEAARRFQDLGLGSTVNFVPLPPLPPRLRGMKTCPLCFGSGAVLNEKQKPILCGGCHGARHVKNARPVAIGDRNFSAHYCLKIAALPGLRVVIDGGQDQPLCFRFDGGEGLLMPLRT